MICPRRDHYPAGFRLTLADIQSAPGLPAIPSLLP